jgi:hypothetical protein
VIEDDGLPKFPCVVCDAPDVLPLAASGGDYKDCKCPTCGQFRITGTMESVLKSWGADKRRLRAGVSAYIRQSNRSGVSPTITWSNDFERMAESFCHTSVSAKLRRVMQHYDEMTTAPGDFLKVDIEHDYPLFDAASPLEMRYLIGILDEQHLLEYDAGANGYQITAAGWEFLEPQKGGVPGSCFVAMAFGNEFDPAYDVGIQPALKACGFESIRVDRIEHTENINDKIISDIRRSQFMVADFSGHRNGVYFEAGYALGLGKTVVWTCREIDFKLDRVHFDTRPFNHIVWETPAELCSKLSNRIRAVVPGAKV